MRDLPRHWRSGLRRFFCCWQAPAVLAVILLVALAVWAVPRRVTRLAALDESVTWALSEAPRRRQVVWRPAEPIAAILPDHWQDAAIIAPRLSDGGATLYCTVRRAGGQADICRSQLAAGKWQPVEPVSELNGESDDIGAVVSRDGQQLFFYSNRPGGHGGFDLYMSTRAGDGWAPPHNLGPRINTPAHEYEPAISPDGRTLYFASNRTPLMAQRTEPSDQQSDETDQWSATLRGHPGLPHFDLYAAERERVDGDWNAAQPLADLNRPGSDEGSPFVSPDGAYLYFASNREARPGEAPNLDLYRAGRAGDGYRPPENLGFTINSEADETEPALSPEGFRLVFSSNRGGRDALYSSAATEVFQQVVWDTSHLAILQKIWLPALMISGVAAALVGVLLRCRGWLVEAAASSQFFAASVVFHLLLVMVLTFWSLPTVVDVIVTKIHEAEAASQPFDNNQHQSHEAGQQAWEKLADLKAAKTTVDVIRRETEPINIPNESERLQPTISLEMARRLPTDQVLYVPPPEQAEVREPQQMTARTLAPPSVPIDVADVAEEIVPRAVKTLKQADVVQPEVLPRALAKSVPPAADMRPRLDSDSLRPMELEVSLPDDVPTPETPQEDSSARRQADDRLQRIVELTEDSQAPILPMATKNELPAEVKQPIELARATPPAPQPEFTAAAPIQSSRLPNSSPAFASDDLDAAEPAMLVTALAPAHRRPTDVEDLSDTELVAGQPRTTVASGQLDARRVEVGMIRRDVSPPRIDVPTPREISGPSQPNRHIAVGQLSEMKIDVPPTLGPIVSRLDRPRARATPVVYSQDSVGMREMFTLRQADIRSQYIELFGGTQDSEKVVNHGLAWLAAHQNADGSWSLHNFHANCQGKHDKCSGAGRVRSNTAATGLALLPFLAAGNTHKSGPYQKQIASAVTWLSQKQKENGDLLAPGDQQHMYSHSIAAIALCEVYGMTNDPQLKAMVEKALDFIVKAQHAGTGGWRYNPNQPADTSVVGWAMMALKSGEMAGWNPPKQTIDNLDRWLRSVEGNKPVGGLFGYQNANATPAMTAEGLLCLQFMGANRDDPRMRAGADYLLQNLPEPNQKRTSYYWYYATQVMYHMQGHYWQAWNARLRDHLVQTQVKEGSMTGTWAPRDNWENSGGRIYATALKLLMLEVYYRHLPLYEQLDE